MASVLIITIALAVLLFCLLFKVPVFISLSAGTALYFLLSPRLGCTMFVQRFVAGIESIPLLAIPFFVGAGVFMNYTGVTKRIMDFCKVLTGRMWGGLAQVNILLSTLMGGLSGSNLADAAMEAKMLVPEMERAGMSKPFSSVITAFSSLITPMIPPGIAMILYGSIANVSVGKLFMTGFVVGALMCAIMMVFTSIYARKVGYAPAYSQRITGTDLWEAAKPAILPLCLPIIIIGGIRLSLFTPTEAGAVAIAYSLFLGLIYKEINLKTLFKGMEETVTTTGVVMLIVGAASVLGWVLTKERIPQTLTEWIVTVAGNKYMFILMVNIFLLLVGMFVEGNAATIVLVPLLVPAARTFGINDIQFAFIFMFNMALGTLTPPLGTVMFVTCGTTGCKIKDFLKSGVRYYALFTVLLLIISYIPEITTFVSNF